MHTGVQHDFHVEGCSCQLQLDDGCH